MKQIVIIGLGELGRVFAGGFLRSGWSVVPVNRGDDMQALAKTATAVDAVLVAVGEADLQSVLKQIPHAWHDRLILLQNELLPHDWQQHHLDPTIISVWFEKKAHTPIKQLIASPVYGKQAEALAAALRSISVDTKIINTMPDMVFELVVKNTYIITTNLVGLVLPDGANVQDMVAKKSLFEQIGQEVLAVQQALSKCSFEWDAICDAVTAACAGDWAHQCKGRSAPARLERIRTTAQQLNISIPTIETVSA